jgi:endonuclease YncB( thermonuclease family)
MPTRSRTKWQRSALLSGCAAAVCGFVLLAAARAQSLDMDASPSTPPAAAAHQSGELDMDVNPSAPVVAKPSAPVVAPAGPKSPIQTLSSGANVQDGIVQVNPTASEQQTATPAPAPSTGWGSPTPATSDPSTASAAPGTSSPGTSGPAVTLAPAAPSAPATPAPASAPVQTTTLTQPPNGSSPASAAPAAPPSAEPVSLDHPTVVDTANLKAGDTSVTLFGIDGEQGEAAQNLQGFLASAGNHVTCQAQTSADYVCLLSDGTDVAQAALINGVARAKADAPDAYRDQEAAAQAARRGIWASLPPPPATVAHPTVRDTATLVADNQTYLLDGLHGLGAPYAGQMQAYIAANGDSLSCSPQDTPGHYICVLGDGTDIAKVALVNGAALVAGDAPDAYRAQQLDALNAHRGIWLNPPPNLMTASAPVAQPTEYVFVAGDDGTDGITYVGGVPEAVIGGAAVFLIYGGDAGWGYYDQWHHWRGAPDRYRAHMERYHPYGHGLRGYHDEAALGRDGMHPGGVHPEGAHPGAHPGEVHTAGLASAHPGVAPTARPSGAAPGAGHLVAPGAHPLTAPGAHPGVGNAGFVRPAPSAGGFHPGGAAAPHVSAPAVHASSGGEAPKHH